MNGITYLDKHSYNDFGITKAPGDKIGYPNKRKILVTVPFSNFEYDFSEIYGDQVYEPRPLTYKFNIYDEYKPGRISYMMKNIPFINWLMNSKGKQKLFDDNIPGYYFLAEVENIDIADNGTHGILTVDFKAYPFMIALLPEGNDIWDDFNFELDVAQNVDFDVSGSLFVTLINPGTPNVVPEIICTNQMTIKKDNIIYTLNAGLTKSEDFVLKSGENEFEIEGNGHISFKFYKELI